MTRLRLALLGQPVGRSLSPVLHRAAGAAVGLDVDYVARETPPEALEAAVDQLVADGTSGFNVTIPHKETVIRLLDARTAIADEVGAVNTVTVEPSGRLLGDNTDVPGFAAALGALPGPRAVVLGTGGAARAVVAALVGLGAERVDVLGRDRGRAEALVAALAADRGAAGLLTEAPERLAGAALVVDALAAPLAPWVAGLPFAALAPGGRVVDLDYGAAARPVLAAAAAADRSAEDGLAMLVHQGLLAFRRWTGREAPYDVVENAVRRAALVDTPIS